MRRRRVMFARPEAKPLIHGRRARAAQKPQLPKNAPGASRAAGAALSLKIEPVPNADRAGIRRGRLSGLQHSGKAPAEMNANFALLEPEAGPCAEELARINESLQARERLLTASARASRLLLEAPDVRAAVPDVLGLIGEAACVDRVNLMLGYTGPTGERLLSVVSEWTATGSRDGKTLEWDGIDVFPIEGGKIKRKDVYSAFGAAREPSG